MVTRMMATKVWIDGQVTSEYKARLWRREWRRERRGWTQTAEPGASYGRLHLPHGFSVGHNVDQVRA